MKRRLALLLLPAAVLPLRAQDRAASDETLRRFVGEWRTHVKIQRPGRAPIEMDGTGLGLESLGGRYVEYWARSSDGSAEDLQINTWDAKAKVYRHWLFDNEGNRFVRTGVASEGGRVITWTAREMGGTVVIHDRFVADDRIEWDMVRRDAAGRVTLRIDARMTRVK